jgi:hypothetical protein
MQCGPAYMQDNWADTTVEAILDGSVRHMHTCYYSAYHIIDLSSLQVFVKIEAVDCDLMTPILFFVLIIGGRDDAMDVRCRCAASAPVLPTIIP